jgi:hypothetical protein
MYHKNSLSNIYYYYVTITLLLSHFFTLKIFKLVFSLLLPEGLGEQEYLLFTAIFQHTF